MKMIDFMYVHILKKSIIDLLLEAHFGWKTRAKPKIDYFGCIISVCMHLTWNEFDFWKLGGIFPWVTA